MKVLLGFIFGALVLWGLIATSLLDDLAIFFIAGVVPGTDTVLSPFVMYGILGMLGCSIFLLMLARHLPRRALAAKAEAAQKTVVIQQHEQAKREAKATAAKRRSRTVRWLWLQKQAYRLWTVASKAWTLLWQTIHKDSLAVSSAVHTTAAPLARTAKRRAAPHAQKAYTKSRVIAQKTAAHTAKVWQRVKHESKYAAHGTALVAQGKVLNARQALANHRHIQRTVDTAKTKIRTVRQDGHKSLSTLIDTKDKPAPSSEAHKAPGGS